MPMFADVYPTTFSEIVGQNEVVKNLETMVARYKTSGEILPHLLFSGPAGCGKTVTAYCVARALFGEDWRKYFKEFNASDDRGIGVVRNRIKPLTEIRGHRIIFLDEADGLTEEAQEALRFILQPDHKLTATFILAVNKPYLISDPIQSRCVPYYFRALTPEDQRKVLISVFKKKGIKLDVKSPEEARQIKDGLEVLIKETNGDMRRALNIVEKIINENKTISPKEVIAHQKVEIVAQALKTSIAGDFDKAREIIEDALILSNYNAIQVVGELYSAIKTEINDRELRAFLYTKLSDTETRCRQGGTPVIHLVAFMAYCYIAPQIDRKTIALARS